MEHYNLRKTFVWRCLNLCGTLARPLRKKDRRSFSHLDFWDIPHFQLNLQGFFKEICQHRESTYYTYNQSCHRVCVPARSEACGFRYIGRHLRGRTDLPAGCQWSGKVHLVAHAFRLSAQTGGGHLHSWRRNFGIYVRPVGHGVERGAYR